MNNISIFYKPAFLNTSSNTPFISKEVSYKGHGHLQRVSSMIRADQIAEAIGARLNPKSGYQADVCIYVKPHVPKGEDFNFEGVRPYLDIIDGWGLLPIAEKHKNVGIIACSKQDQQILEDILKREVVYIPQHHANYNREKRNSHEIKTIGMIGTSGAYDFLPVGFEAELNKRGLKLLFFDKFFSRQDIIDFYKQVDLQIVWRPYRMRLSNPLKIVNASSFGIPTIAYEESVFQEMDGCYLPVQNMKQFFNRLELLMNQRRVYLEYSERCLRKAEEYHIEKVAELYKQL